MSATSSINSSQQHPIYINLDEIQESSSPPQEDPSAPLLREIENNKKKLEQRDETIRLQMRTIDRLSRQIEENRAKIATIESSLNERENATARTESEVTILQRQLNALRQANPDHVQPAIQLTINPPTSTTTPLPLWKRMWNGVKKGVSTVGSFFKRHSTVIELTANIVVAGVAVGLVFVFPEVALPIMLLGALAALAFRLGKVIINNVFE